MSSEPAARPVQHYVYFLLSVFLVILFSILTLLVSLPSRVTTQKALVIDYHLETIHAVHEIESQLLEIETARLERELHGIPGGPSGHMTEAEAQERRFRLALSVIENHIEVIRAVQATFALPDQESIVRRAVDLWSSLPSGPQVGMADFDAEADRLHSLNLTMDQLERMHLAALRTTQHRITELQHRNTAALIIATLVMLGLGGLITVRILRGIGAIEIAKDRTAANLRESEARSRGVVEAVGDGLITIDERGTVETFNAAAARIFGYGAKEVIGRNVSMLMPEPHRREHDAYLARYLSSGRPLVLNLRREVTGRREDGSTFPMELHVSEAQLADRRIFTGIVRDVSEYKLLEEEFRQAQKMEAVGRLAGGIAHDFNNLLTAINGYTDLLLSQVEEGGSLARDLHQIGKAGDRAALLTGQLLAFSRKQVLKPCVLNLNDTVANVEKLLLRVIGEDVELRCVADPDLKSALLDAGQIEQIILNLAVNARDAMPDGGKLTIETANARLDAGAIAGQSGIEPGDYVLLSITDTGCGMDEATRAHAFDPFFTTKEAGKGTGLGLAMVYGIVKQSGGFIQLVSEPGRGTAMKIYFPPARVEAAPEAPEAASPAPLQWGTETILLVEDEPVVRDLSRRVLAEHGYTVIERDSAESALEYHGANGSAPHLLLTDVILPGMNGPALAGELRTRYPALGILYMSGYTEDAIVHRGVLDEGVDFLPKPFSPDDLLDAVRRVLDSQLVSS